MARTSRDPQLVTLKRRQLDANLKGNASAPTPRGGWIRANREALGMSSLQLGRRLGVSQQEAADLERRERTGSITIATLTKAASGRLRNSSIPGARVCAEYSGKSAMLKRSHSVQSLW